MRVHWTKNMYTWELYFLDFVLTFLSLLKMYPFLNFHHFSQTNFVLPDSRINFLNLHVPYNVKYFLPQLYQKNV